MGNLSSKHASVSSKTSVQDLNVETDDGVILPVSCFAGEKSGPVVIITSAVAVPRKIYRHFAQFLVQQGAGSVYTYDFRGIGSQQLTDEQLKSIGMTDWALRDFPAIVDFAKSRHPEQELLGIGHSFGSQVLGMGEKHNQFSRYLGIACGSGYIKHTRQPIRLALKMRILGWLSLFYRTKIPESLSLGTQFPTGVFREWKKWSSSPNYMMSDPKVASHCQFENVTLPIRFVGFSDDLYVTAEAFNELRSWYTKACQSIDWINCESSGRPVGHFGFFKQENSWLWPTQAQWLMNGQVTTA